MQQHTRRFELLAGVRAQAPLLLGVAPFGTAYGAYAVESGLSGGLTQAMSSVIFAGASQFVAVQLIASGVPGIMIVLAVLLVNARHMLYSASVAPYVEQLHARWRWLLAYLLTDEAYAVGLLRYGGDDGSQHKHWYFLGSAAALWVTWQITTAIGILLGETVPESWSLDFTLPLVFIALLVPVLKTKPAMVAAGVAGLIAVVGFDWPYGTELFAAIVGGLLAGAAAERMLGTGAAVR